MPGVTIRYTKPNNGLALIPLLHKPYQWDSLKKVCNLCQVSHPVQTLHLWLNDQDECIVAIPVLRELQKAGLPDLIVKDAVAKPPTLHIGRQPRQAEDFNNRRINIHYQLLIAAKRAERKAAAKAAAGADPLLRHTGDIKVSLKKVGA